MKWFMAAALSVTAFLAMTRSVVAPVVIGPDRLEYLFLTPSLDTLLFVAGAAVAVTLALRALAIRLAAPLGREAEARTGRWMAPLCLLALSVLPFAVFVPGLAQAGAPFVFVGVDLRLWILALALLLTACELSAVLGGTLTARVRGLMPATATARLFAWDTLVLVACIAWAVGTMPVMRFSGTPHGDEPKYLRYVENWYQGNGFDLRPKQLMSDMRLDAASQLSRNLVLATGAVAEEASALVDDVRHFAQEPADFRWNRAEGGDNWFLTGKRGGVYQVHTPGLSAVLLPAYYLDRHFLDLEPGHQGEVPSGLFMTNLTLLLIYAVWGVVMFRLLRRLLTNEALAAALAVLAMVTLPVTSFAFQMYPETVAGLATTLVLLLLLFPDPAATARRALALGCVCGFLPWAHIRFSVLSLVLIAYACLPRSGTWRQRRAFLAGYAAMVALMCVYAYRLTGSAMPNAMFSADGTADPFDASLIAPFFVGYMVDRIWGILPHVPVYLLAFAGLIPLWRTDRGHAVLFAAMYLSLAVPSAAHSLNAAGATPGRHLVAVLPLAVWPLALAIRDRWGSRLFRATFATLTLLSLQAAFVYNWWHTKDTGRMWDASVSGWKANLLFAWTHGDVWATSSANFWLFLAGMAVIASLVLVGARRPYGSAPAIVRPSLIAAGLTVVAAGGAAAATLTGDAFRDDYTQHPLVSRRQALWKLADLERCTFCAASGRGQVDAASMTWHAVSQFDVFVLVDDARTAHIRVVANAPDDEPAFGHVRIEYGDGTYSPSTPVAGLRRLTHTYAQPGRYMVRAHLMLPDETTRETYTEVEVR